RFVDSATTLRRLEGLVDSACMWPTQEAGLCETAPGYVGGRAGDDHSGALARSVRARAPREFALAGLSMGGYVALEIMRASPGRVRALALLDTQARPDTPEASKNRREQVQRAETDFEGIIHTLFPTPLHAQRRQDHTW